VAALYIITVASALRPPSISLVESYGKHSSKADQVISGKLE
jgi:hypothetical protein